MRNLDKVVSNIAAWGIPGLILLIAIEASGLAGAAAITFVLAAIGGPFGMLGGIGVMGAAVLILRALGEFGFEVIYKGVVKQLYKEGRTKEDILYEIQRYRISKNLKRTLKEVIEQQDADASKDN